MQMESMFKIEVIMDYEKEIPFGAFDSELMRQEIYIPKGFEAVIKGNKIILEKTESEDEKVRKELINIINLSYDCGIAITKENRDRYIAWLEKQSEQKSVDDLTQQEAMDIAVAKCFEQGEQKPTNKPKFKVGDKLVSTKNPRLTYEVLKVGNVNELGNLEYEIEIFTDEKPGIQVGDTFKEHNIHLMECVKVDEWAKLVDEAKPKWTEEDEAHLHSITTHLGQWIERHPNTCGADIQCENFAWLESLKQRMEGRI